MGKTIIITEKPSVAQEYKRVLGVRQSGQTEGYIEGFSPVLSTDVQITFAVGHLVTLARPIEQKDGRLYPSATLKADKDKQWYGWNRKDLPIIPDSYLYTVIGDVQKQFGIVKGLFQQKDIDRIYYAGDSGREGIYIQALIRNQIFKKTPKFDERVVWIDSYTDESIKNGIRDARPYSDYANMIASGYTRAIWDWLIGMNLSPAISITHRVEGAKSIAVGRVMTPTLGMVVQKQKEIDEFKPTDYFGVKATPISGCSGCWQAISPSRYEGSPLLYNDKGFKKRTDAESLLAEFCAVPRLTLISLDVKDKQEYAPLLFNLADLQAYCSSHFHISPAKTLEIAQSLYEAKRITYPRTDARVLTSAVAKELASKGHNVPARYVDDRQVTDHYAIIPTGSDERGGDSLTQKVYEAIKTRFECIFEAPYCYKEAKFVFEHANGERFYATDKYLVSAGYKALLDETLPQTMPLLPKKGEQFDSSFTLNAMTTQAPQAYTTGSLVLAMERAGNSLDDRELRSVLKGSGIGTSATRAGIIEKLIAKGYMTVDKKQKITPTETGKKIIPIIGSADASLISPEKTALLEQELEDIASGKRSVDESMAQFNEYIRSSVAKILGSDKGAGTETDYRCCLCGKPMRDIGMAHRCDCGLAIYHNMCGRELKGADIALLLSKKRTGVMSFTSKKGKPFTASLYIDEKERKVAYDFD